MRFGLTEERCRRLTVVEIFRHVRARRWHDRRQVLLSSWHTAVLMRGTRDLPSLAEWLDPSLAKARPLHGAEKEKAEATHDSLIARMLK